MGQEFMINGISGFLIVPCLPGCVPAGLEKTISSRTWLPGRCITFTIICLQLTIRVEALVTMTPRRISEILHQKHLYSPMQKPVNTRRLTQLEGDII